MRGISFGDRAAYSVTGAGSQNNFVSQKIGRGGIIADVCHASRRLAAVVDRRFIILDLVTLGDNTNHSSAYRPALAACPEALVGMDFFIYLNLPYSAVTGTPSSRGDAGAIKDTKLQERDTASHTCIPYLKTNHKRSSATGSGDSTAPQAL